MACIMTDKAERFLERLNKQAFECAASSELESVAGDMQGWISGNFDEVFSSLLRDMYARQGGRPLVILEVGTWKGLSTHRMARAAKDSGIPVKIVTVDTWLGAPEFWTWGLESNNTERNLMFKLGYPQVYYTFLKNMCELGHDDVVCPLPLSSAQAVEVLRYYNVKADIIYIDAAHEYDAVKQDIQNYWTLMSSGGIMFGDDYTGYWSGVVRAVDEAVVDLALKKEVNDIVWKLEKA